MIVEQVYRCERENLSRHACLSENTRGRLGGGLEPDGVRTDFQRDRDRIIHAKAFRRLMHKTQVFLDPEGDHYRTRLTHTLEAAQIGRALARALRLNEDLTEAACLGHDLGHTPFGHTGEAVLDKLHTGGFRHNEQSLRVVDRLEKDFAGLNLTHEVRDAILKHNGEQRAQTLEGRLVKLADRIAYINHDIDDAVRARLLKSEDLPAGLIRILGGTHSKRINTMVRSVISESLDKPDIKMGAEVQEAADALRSFLFERVYYKQEAKAEGHKAERVLVELYAYFMKNYSLLLPEYGPIIEAEGVGRAVCDYLAGMTDRYAINKYCELFVPKTWKL